MSEPKSWLEEGAPEDIDRLLRAAREELPDDTAPGRILIALGVGLGATSIAGGAGAAGAGTAVSSAALITGASLAKWGVLGATLGTLAVGAVTVLRHGPSAPPTGSARPAVPEASATRPAPLGAEQLVPETTPQASVAEAAKPRSAVPAPSAAVLGADVPLDAETLAEEVRHVDRARAALTAGRATETLAALDEYDRRFPNRRFAPEALYLRMEALESLGRTAAARDAAERLLTHYPTGPHGVRARVVLGKNP